MNKDEAIKILDDFYEDMKKAELLAYESCKKRDKQMEYLFDVYADIIINFSPIPSGCINEPNN